MALPQSWSDPPRPGDDSDPTAQVDAILEGLEGMAPGPQRLALAEQAVHLADHHRLADRAYLGRVELSRAATYAGRPDKAVVAFSWCLHRPDACPDPQLYQLHILSEMPTVVDQLAKLPQMPRRRIVALADEMEQRHDAAGLSLKSARLSRHIAALFMGDLEEAENLHRLWQQTPPDLFSPEPPDDRFFTVQWLANSGRDGEALEVAQPVLRRYGSRLITESTNPFLYHGLPTIVLLPLIREGRLDEADVLQRRCLPQLTPWPFCLSFFAGHALTAAVLGRLDEALAMIGKHLHHAAITTDVLDQFSFFRAAWFVLERARRDGRTQLPFSIPGQLRLGAEHPRCDIVRAVAWFGSEVQRLADQFDRRNGNAYISQQINRVECLHDYARPIQRPTSD